MLLTRQTAPDGVVTYTSPQLAAAGVRHAFATRLGGVSRPPFDALNLGNPSGCDQQDDAASLAQNYARLLAAAGCAELPRCSVHQVHGADVLVVGPGTFPAGQRADALATAEPDRVLSVRSADCCPVLIATADGRAAAAAHAGWRGAVAGVVSAAAAAVCELAGVGPGCLVAAVGPCIGFDAFEVGPDVLAQFADAFGDDADLVRRDAPGGKGHASLPEACRRSLMAAGVPADRIDTTDRCTVRDAGEFFSHRRDHGVTGRMASVIAVREDFHHGDTEARRRGNREESGRADVNN